MAAALELVEAEGLEALSARAGPALRVGGHVGLYSYPNASPLVATRRWTNASAAAAGERMVDCFARLGAGEVAAWRRARTLGAYLGGAGMALAAWKRDLLQAAVRAPSADARLERKASAVRADLYLGFEMVMSWLLLENA